MKSISSFLKQGFSKTNKYVLTGIIFVVVTFFIGDSTLFNHYEYEKQINDLGNEIAKYKKEKEGNELKLKMLKRDNDSLERFARETFLMTKPGEELFIIK